MIFVSWTLPFWGVIVTLPMSGLWVIVHSDCIVSEGFVNSEGSCAEGNTENQRKIANWDRRRFASEPGQGHFGIFLDLEAEHVQSKT